MCDFSGTGFTPMPIPQPIGTAQDMKDLVVALTAFGSLVAELLQCNPQPKEETPKTPQDVAIMALQLWKDGAWSKAHAMKVVHAALDEYREHIDVYSREVPAYRAALPSGMKQTDAQLIDQLFA